MLVTAVAGLMAGALLPAPVSSAPASAAVQVGLEVVEADRGAPLQGKRVGLVVTPGSVTADGRHSIDVLRKAGVNVVRLFAHERALRTRTAVWDRVAQNLDGTPFLGRPEAEVAGRRVDADTRLPIVDLGSAKLGAEDVRDLDAVVFDLQDPGVRFFTVMGRLQQGMETAAEAGIDFVVLDRPNPLGGDLVEGPTREAGPTVRAVLTNQAPAPLVHGLTTGEMAQLIRSGLGKPLRLTVVPMKGWKRSMTWTDTGRPWASIAPNLRTPEAALAYPGLGLLEATNVSEGRGTDQPFLLFGAPWLDDGKLPSVSATGFAIERARFTPRASAFAVNPKHKDAECMGGRLSVRDTEGPRPYALGVHLLRFLTGQRGIRVGGAHAPSTIWWARRACAGPWMRGRARPRSSPRTRPRSRSSAGTARSSCSTDEAAVGGTDRERHESNAVVDDGRSAAMHPDTSGTRQTIHPPADAGARFGGRRSGIASLAATSFVRV